MKAIIVKNDEFKTIGFNVISKDGKKVYSWGNCVNEYCYCKHISLDEEQMLQVISLIRMEQELNDVKDIPTRFMFDSISNEQHEVIRKAAEKGKCKSGYCVKNFMDREAVLKTKIEEIISSFK